MPRRDRATIRPWSARAQLLGAPRQGAAGHPRCWPQWLSRYSRDEARTLPTLLAPLSHGPMATTTGHHVPGP